MDDLALLRPKLARLKLSGMLDTLNERLQQALAEKWSYTRFLDTLLTDEAERRDFKQLARRLTKSGLAPDKTLETFDFSFNPRIHAPTLRELATCRFVLRTTPGTTAALECVALQCLRAVHRWRRRIAPAVLWGSVDSSQSEHRPQPGMATSRVARIAELTSA